MVPEEKETRKRIISMKKFDIRKLSFRKMSVIQKINEMREQSNKADEQAINRIFVERSYSKPS